MRAEAKSTTHLLTHLPFNPYCDACNMGKMAEKYHFKGTMKRPLAKWGEILTADHLVSRTAQKKDRSGWEGCNGAKNALNI